MFYGLGMTTATMPDEQEWGWPSWLGGKKPPNKGGDQGGAEATPSNKMATYIGVTLGVVLCGAALATGLSWLLLLAGGSPIAGIVIDKRKYEIQKQEQADANRMQENLVEGSKEISDELNSQNPNNQPLLLKENFFKHPPKEYMELLNSLSLSKEQIGILYNNLPEKASSQDFYALTQSFLTEAEQENQPIAPETDEGQPSEVKNKPVVQETKENLAEEKEPAAVPTEAEKTPATLDRETDPNYIALIKLANTSRNKELGIG
jgi:hypothetical protein